MIRDREKHSSRISGIIVSVLSVLVFFAAFEITGYFVDGYIYYSSEYLVIGLMIIPLWYLGLNQTNLTGYYPNKHNLTLIFETGLFVITGTGFLALVQLAFSLQHVNNYVILVFAILDFILISTLLISMYYYQKKLQNKGLNIQNIVIITDSNSVDLIEKMFHHQDWGYNVVSIISDSDLVKELFGRRVDVLTNIENLPALLRQNVVDEVLYCKNNIDQEEIKKIVSACEDIGIIFRLQTSFIQMQSTRTHMSYYEGLPFLTFSNTPASKFSHHWKLLFDIFVSVFVLIIWAPFMVVISIAIKLDSKGPVIFRQKRVGLRGRTFDIFKFRTMHIDAEEKKALLENMNEMDGPVFKIKNDPRITKVGGFLRKTGLDEIPQFLNVINGDMSLVGPRPPLPSEVKEYERWQLRRLSMRPGITCIWQIAPNRNKITFNEWMKLDLQYIDSWSLKLDLLLLVKTVQTVIRGSGQ